MSVSIDEASLVAAARAGDFRRVLEPKTHLIEAIRASPALAAGEPRDVLRQLGEAATRLLEVERVGVWALDDAYTKLTCLDLFTAESGRHTSGTTITRTEAPHYFALVLQAEVITVDDAMTDPRTGELARSYLPAFGVTALLDCPILIERRIAGVLRAEHVGGTRRWQGWERLLGSTFAECAGVAIGVARGASSGLWRRLAG
jgi:two-component system sensor histidine kinase/response regulator